MAFLVPLIRPAQGQDDAASLFVDDLLGQMTIEEKVGQMTQLTLDVVSAVQQTDSTELALDSTKLREALLDYHVGSILNVYLQAPPLEVWQQTIAEIQDVAINETRLGIPVIYGIDAVHGHNYLLGGTVFPQNIGMAATWNPGLVRQANEITALEMRASGIPWNFSPVLDIGRQPLWSRFFETFGEDVHLTTQLGLAAVEGLQGEDTGGSARVAACLKHYLGYSLPLSGRDRTPAWIPERMLREIVLPPFAEAVEAGAATVMINSGEINGVPVHASREILTDLLRDELGFEGVAVSDWEDIIKLHTVHKVAESPKEAVRIAVEAGVDMSMVPYNYSFATHLIELVEEGTIPETRIDQSVRRILRLKHDVGLFDRPGHSPDLADKVATEASLAVSREAAAQSITLLKNDDDILPLTGDKRIFVTGYGAASLPALHGSWTYTWQGTDEDAYPTGLATVVDVLVDSLGIERVTYVPGTSATADIDIGAAVEEAFRADVAVVVLAEYPTTEKPGDIQELELPQIQRELVRKIAATGTPIVLVLAQNRPRIIRDIEPLASAFLLTYQPGPYGPQAIVDILLGHVNPSGRLPFTYPRYSGSIVPYDHKNAETLGPTDNEPGFDPQWEFGSGLSFTTFEYSNLAMTSDSLSASGKLEFAVDVANTGSRDGMEVIQVYVRDDYASVTPPVRRLRAFRKVSLAAGSTETVAFSIPVADLSFVGRDNRAVVEPGTFELQVGSERKPFVVE